MMNSHSTVTLALAGLLGIPAIASQQDGSLADLDAEQRIVTTPAYMLGPGIKDVAVGIERCVAEVLEMVGQEAVA